MELFMRTSPSHPVAKTLEAYLADSKSWAQTSRSLQRIAKSVVGDSDLAEDIVQSAWVEALRRGPAKLGLGWIRRLVHSRSIDALRGKGRAPSMGASPNALELPHDEDTLGSKIEVQREVLDAVDALDEPYRTAIYLRYFEDLGPRSIAKQLGVPEKTIKTRLTRAHRLLRERLSSSFQDKQGRWTPALLGFADFHQAGSSTQLAITASAILMKKTVLAFLTLLALLAGWLTFSWSRGESRPALALGEAHLPTVDEAPLKELAGPDRSRIDGDRVSVPSEAQAPAIQAASAPISGSLQVQVRRADGTPAAGVHVVATTEHEIYNLRKMFRRRSDDHGVAYFSVLPIGTVSLQSDRSSRESQDGLAIRAGEQTEAMLLIPEGVRVSVQVNDHQSRPVAHAGIWLTSTSGGWTGGAVVGHSDAAGHFEIEDVPAGQSLGAIADGFQPSALSDLDLIDISSGSVSITLALTPGGASLRGTVTGEDGLAVPGALVLAGKSTRFSNMRMDQTRAESWSPRSTRTDDLGQYAFEGLPASELPVQVRSQEHAIWNGSAKLDPGREASLDMRLSQGVLVHGRVTNGAGQAVPKALLLAFQEPVIDRYLQSGQVDHGGALAGPATVSDQDGYFALEQVSPGKAWLYAMEPRQDIHSHRELIRHAKLQQTLAPNSQNLWNPVLADGRVIEGNALYADRHPITEVFVILEGPTDNESRTTHTEDGSFRFINLGPGPYSIRVQMWSRPEGESDPRVDGVLPDGPPIDVFATFDSPQPMETATVSVRLRDPGRRAANEAAVILEADDPRSWHYGDSDGDQWSFSIDTPGVFRALALSGERLIGRGADFEILGGEKLELPPLVTQDGATLVLHIERPDELRVSGLRAFLRHDASAHAEPFELGGESELRIENLEPGSGRISFLGGNVRQMELPFELRAGEETLLAVPLSAAVPVLYRIEWPSEQSSGSLSLSFVERQSGALMDDFQTDDLSGYSSPIQWNVYLPLGSYLFEVKKNGSPYYREEFEVTSLDPEKAPKLSTK